MDGVANRLFIEPLARGSYPEDVVEALSGITDWSFVQDGDLKQICRPLDSLGVNYYQPVTVSATAPENAPEVTDGQNSLDAYPGCADLHLVELPGPRTGQGWLIEPTGLTRLLVRVARDFPDVPLMVTENGAAYDPGPPDAPGWLQDDERIEYLRSHVRAARDAIDAGVDLRGYMVWSLLDNFEWAFGYSERFGLVHVDFPTGRRTPRRSAAWLRDVIRGNGPDSTG
jgi:beta-glucosidase